MSLEDVKRAVQDKTKAEVEAVLQQGRVESQRITQEAQEQIQRKREAHEEQTKRTLEALERKEQASAQFIRKTILLEEKRKAVDDVFVQLQSMLANMPAADRAQLHKTLASKANNAIDVKKCRCNSKDVAVLSKEFPQASVIADPQVSGGFTAEDASGSVRIDYTFETILDTVRERTIADLTEQLFS